MRNKKKQVPGLDPVRSFPYYKIQVWNARVSAWRDIQKKSGSLEELHGFALAKLARTETTRIMIVEDYGSRRVDESFDAFGEFR